MQRLGMTQAQVAAQFGVSQKTADRHIAVLEVDLRPPLVRAVPSEQGVDR